MEQGIASAEGVITPPSDESRYAGRRSGERPLTIALSLTFGISTLNAVLIPLIVAVFADRGMAGHLLGALAFMEYGGSAIGALACSVLVKRWGALALSVSGAGLMLVGNLGAGLSMGNLYAVFIGTAAAGLGSGLLMSGTLAEAARTGLDTRSFGAMMAAAAILSSISYLAGPHALAIADGRGVYLLLAIFGAIALAAMRLASSAAKVFENAADTPMALSAKHAAMRADRKSQAPLTVVALCTAAYLLYVMGETSLWIFAIPLGQSYGLSISFISYLFVGAMMVGFFPPLTAGLIERKLGIGKSIGLCILALILANIVLVLGKGAFLYTALFPARLFLQALICPLFFSLFAHRDTSGQAVAAAIGAGKIGQALCPLPAGYLVDLEHANFIGLGLFSSAAWAGSLAMVVILLLRAPGTPSTHR